MTLPTTPISTSSKKAKKAPVAGVSLAKKWFQGLQNLDQQKVANEFKSFVLNNTSVSEDTKCQEIKDGISTPGFSNREKDQGRRQIKPFIWANNIKNIGVVVPKTDAKDKGPEINVAAFWGVVHDIKEEGLVCSHLCHNKKCINLEHLCWEKQEINNHRNSCGGKNLCIHKPRCIVPGPTKIDSSETLVWNAQLQKWTKPE